MTDVRAHVVNSLPGRWGYVQEFGDGRLLLQRHDVDNSSICATDSRLAPIWEFAIPSAGGCHSVSTDLSRIAVSLPDEVRLLDHGGTTVGSFGHAPWGPFSSGATAFDHDGRHLWAIVPTTDDAYLLVLERDSLNEVERRSLQSEPAGAQPIHHPQGRTIGWSIGEGQDRALIGWSSLEGEHIKLRLLPDDDRVLAAIHPTGDEYLTAPHSTGALQRHRFADDRVVGQVKVEEGLSWDFVAGYLDADRILASVRADDEQELLLVRCDPMSVAAKVILARSANSWSSLLWVGAGTWASTGDRATELWSLD